MHIASNVNRLGILSYMLSLKHKMWMVYLVACFALFNWATPCLPNTDSPEVLLDELSSVWSAYRYRFLKNGRVIEHDEGDITTSEAQSYAMLRSVWLGDEFTFDASWTWTKQNLQVRQDKLFAWKYKNRVLDTNAATDADTDIALALFLAADRFHHDEYRLEAQKIARDIYLKEFLVTPIYVLPTAGNWTKNQQLVKIHTGYLAPNAYEVFAVHMPELRWRDAVDSSYKLLHWMLDDQKLKLPPEFIFYDRKKKAMILKESEASSIKAFTYDVFPLLWRIAVDQVWFHRHESDLHKKLLAPFRETWRMQGKIFEKCNVRDGLPTSENVAPTLAATVRSLASESGQKDFAVELQTKLIKGYWSDLVYHGDSHPYYAQNWLWFDAALTSGLVRHFRESPSILQEFRSKKFLESLPWTELMIAVILFLLGRRSLVARRAFLVVAFFGLIRYIVWRATNTLNASEAMGPIISGSLWLAELYGLVTHLLLWVQVGTPKNGRTLDAQKDLAVTPEFSVDILIPIYSESLEILHKTVAAALVQRYQNFKIYVCDDSHRDSVKELCERLGVTYVKGPKRHAKSGNLNNAMKFCQGELVVIFDTDHIPVESFLCETVPLFVDEKLGFVQTPHYFFNQDIFQKSTLAPRSLGNELNLFNFGIMARRDDWGGAFFIGSGAVFRRVALDGIGGFQLLSITEDIHTSQVLHSAGWHSQFVNKRLVAGLAAESLTGHIAQRKRWMQGCLQIFFKDNPLFRSGLSLRLKFAYLGSLLYFFFPGLRLCVSCFFTGILF